MLDHALPPPPWLLVWVAPSSSPLRCFTLLLVVVVLGAAFLLLLALCCTALFVLLLARVALVVAVVAVLGALIQLMGCRCRSWGMAVVVGPYILHVIWEPHVSSTGAISRRVVFVVDGLYCQSGVCCAMCHRWDSYCERLQLVTTVGSSCRFGCNSMQK
jgi:hypothetical protein